MATTHAVVAKVKAESGTNAVVGSIAAPTVAKLYDAKEEFALAPDEYIDVGRLPPVVVGLDSLITYLRSVKAKLSARDNKVKTEDWEVAKSGELKLYKLFTCCIHGLHYYISSSPDESISLTDYTKAVISAALAHAPSGLSASGTTLWQKTFDQTYPRTQAVMRTLIVFCKEDTAANASATPAPAPAAAASPAAP